MKTTTCDVCKQSITTLDDNNKGELYMDFKNLPFGYIRKDLCMKCAEQIHLKILNLFK